MGYASHGSCSAPGPPPLHRFGSWAPPLGRTPRRGKIGVRLRATFPGCHAHPAACLCAPQVSQKSRPRRKTPHDGGRGRPPPWNPRKGLDADAGLFDERTSASVQNTARGGPGWGLGQWWLALDLLDDAVGVWGLKSLLRDLWCFGERVWRCFCWGQSGPFFERFLRPYSRTIISFDPLVQSCERGHSQALCRARFRVPLGAKAR
jgi:hypothetical protein